MYNKLNKIRLKMLNQLLLIIIHRLCFKTIKAALRFNRIMPRDYINNYDRFGLKYNNTIIIVMNL